MIFTVLLVVVIAWLGRICYNWATSNDEYFAAKKLPHLRPYFLLGNLTGFYFQRYRTNEFLQGLYDQFPTDKLFGIFEFRKPLLVLRDPHLIKQLAVKDFDHFEDHRHFIDSEMDEMLSNSMTFLKGQKWRHMRATLSPAFTGSKMRTMFELVNDCCADMTEALRAKLLTRLAEVSSPCNEPPMELDMKSTFSLYANDVIASTAFGYRVNSFVDESNAFLINGRRLVDMSQLTTAIRMLIGYLCPPIWRHMNWSVLDARAMTFFKDIVMQTIRERQAKGISRPDMIQMLMQFKAGDGRRLEQEKADYSTTNDGFATAEESQIAAGVSANERQWTDVEITSQCFLFFFAGFDTVSSLLSFLAYELAINPEAQQTLYEECRAVQLELLETDPSGKLPYDRLQRMQYMDQSVSEALRMWPPAMFTDRQCVKDYSYDDGELRFDVEQGTTVWIPITALHHDPKYFHDPERFIPERFSEENRHSIVAGSYLPFGVGPRNCIASRFALMEVKAAIYHLILTFSFEPTLKTQIPLKLAKSPGGVLTEQGIHLEFKLRNGGS